MMEILPRQLALLGVCAAIALAIGFADAVHGESSTTAPVVVVGLAKCSDCTRKSMNTEAAFKGLKVAVKCKSGKGEYESKAMGQVDKSGAFAVPLDADLVGENGELKQDCFAQLHSASNVPCPGQEPSKVVAAEPSLDGGKMTFAVLAGKMHQLSAECASVFLCYPVHKYHPVVFHKPTIVPPKYDHEHVHDHDHNHDHDHDHDHSLPPVVKPPSMPMYGPKPTPIYHPPAKHDVAPDTQLFKKLVPFFKKHDHNHHHVHNHNHDHDHDHDHNHDHDHDHSLPSVVKTPSTPVYRTKPTPIYHPLAQHDVAADTQLFKKLIPFLKKHDRNHQHDHDHDHDHNHDHSLPPVSKPPSTPVYRPKPTRIYHPPTQHGAATDPKQFKKLLPSRKKLPFFPPAEQKSNP